MKEGDVKVADWVSDFHGFRPDVVCCSDDCPCFNASTGHQDRHCLVVVPSADRIDASSAIVVGSASEFTQPKNQGVL